MFLGIKYNLIINNLIQIKDELIYCFGNIIQNAVQHARKVINVDIKWDIKEFLITIEDDGLGFKSDILEKIRKEL